MLVPFLPSLFQPQRITWSWAETRHEFLPEPPLEAWLSCLLGTHFLLSEEQTSPCVLGTRGCPKNSDPGLWGCCTGVLSTACRWPAGGSHGALPGAPWDHSSVSSRTPNSGGGGRNPGSRVRGCSRGSPATQPGLRSPVLLLPLLAAQERRGFWDGSLGCWACRGTSEGG